MVINTWGVTDEWEESCLAQSAHKYVKECKGESLEPANEYLQTSPSNRAVRHNIQQQSSWLDVLVTRTRRAKLDRMCWSRN
jgi:hypothetical protein